MAARAGSTVAKLIVGKIFGIVSILFAFGFLAVGVLLSFLNYIYTTIVSAIVSFVNGITCSIPFLGCQGQNVANSITSSLNIPSAATLGWDALLFLIIGASFLIISVLLFVNVATVLMVFVFLGLVAFVVLGLLVFFPLPSIFWQFLKSIGI